MILPLKEDCDFWDGGCKLVNAIRGTIVESWRDSISDALGEALKTLGSFWIEVKTPEVDTNDSIAAWMNAYLEPVAAVTAVGCLIGAGIQLALARDGGTAQLQNLVMGIAKMIGVSFIFIPFAGLAHTFSDAISIWIIKAAMGADDKNFGKNIITIGAAVPAGIVVFAGLIGLVVTIMQIGLMYARAAMLILICSIVPVVGSTMTTKTGLNWWKKLFGWWVAFVLYKPFASIIYAIAFKLFEKKDILGEHSFDDLGTFLMGIMLLIFATLALPALISFLSPVIEGAAPLSGGGAMGMLKMPEGSSQPTGARNVNSSSSSGSGGGGGGQNSSNSSGGSGSGSGSGSGGGDGGTPSGSRQTAGAGGGSGSGSGGGQSSSGGGSGSGSGSGSGNGSGSGGGGGGTPSGSKSTPAPGGSSTGAGGGGAAGGGSAAGGASGAAAAHPAVAVAVGVAKGAAAVVQGVNRAANETTNQGN